MSEGTPTQYYDRFVLKPNYGLLEVDFFCNAIGMAEITWSTTNLVQSNQFNACFVLDGLVLYRDDTLEWQNPWLDFIVRYNVVARVNTRVSRLTGQADVLGTDPIIINRFDRVSASLRWPTAVVSDYPVVLTVIAIGRTYPENTERSVIVSNPQIFARVLGGNELSDKSGIMLAGSPSQVGSAGSFQVPTLPSGVVKSQPVKSGLRRKFNFEE